MTISVHLDHVGITVTRDDLAATIDWYARHLGFTLERQFDVYTFLVSANTRIELVAGASARPPAETGDIFTTLDQARLHHVCLAVDDLDAAVADLHDGGVDLIGGPMEIAELGRRIAFVTDNVGTIIELSGPGRSGT